MAREQINGVKKTKTTIVTNETLLDRVGSHVLKRGDTLTDFMTRAILNQWENEGDLEIRALIEEENEMEEL